MLELIYCGEKHDYDLVKKSIMEKYPDALLEDASDEIHQYRLEVAVECDRDEFVKFAIRDGFAIICLGIQLEMRTSPQKLLALIDEIKEEKNEKTLLQ